MDVHLAMLSDLRVHGRTIPLYDVEARELWFDAVAQVLSAMPNKAQAWAQLILIAQDTCQRMPGLPLEAACLPLLMRCPATWANQSIHENE